MTDRSEAEREAARIERERRRTGSAGQEVREPAALAPAPAAPAQPQAPESATPAPEGHDFDPVALRPSGSQAGASGMPHRPVTIPRPRRRRGLRRVAAALVLLVVAAALYVANGIFTPLRGNGSGAVTVVVPAGAGARSVGNQLAREHVVGSGLFFSLRAGIAGKRDRLRSGTFHLRRNMSNLAALRALTTAPKAAPTISVTLPEGPSRGELKARVGAAGVRGDYLRATAHSADLNPRRFGAPKSVTSLEGFLFPATYQLRRGATADALVQLQLKAFRRALGAVSLRRAKHKHLTAFDVLTIASLVEREVAVPSERRLVAAVIYNRLHQGIALGIDASTRFAVHNWTRPLRQSQLASDSPYNTRKHQGLPPGPIGNPGLASIKAAANPARVSFLFYVVKPCANGRHNFSSTDARFQRDVAAYNAKREQLGGKDPSRCP